MRTDLFTKVLSTLALLVLCAVVGSADNPAPAEPAAVKLPGDVTRGVVRGDHLYAVAAGRLIDVDLKRQEVKDIAVEGAKLTPYLDVADGKACIAAADRLVTVDLATGKAARSMEFSRDVRGLGFIDADRVFVIGGSAVAVVDLAAGKIVRTIEVAPADEAPQWRKRESKRVLTAFQLVGERLYLADAFHYYDSRLSVIDLDEGKVLDRIGGISFWSTGLQVVGDKAFVPGVNLGYGVNSPEFVCIDLKTKKPTALKHGDIKERIPDEKLDQLVLCGGGDDAVFLSWGAVILQCDSQGRVAGKTTVKDCGRLLGVWNGQALTAGKGSLVLTPLARSVSKSD
jgi:hypothetical protein